MLEEYQGSSLSKVYNYGLDLISQRVPTTSTNYFIYDGHGSTRILDSITLEAWRMYLRMMLMGRSSLQTLHRKRPISTYCGQQFDFDLGLYLNRALVIGIPVRAGFGQAMTMDMETKLKTR